MLYHYTTLETATKILQKDKIEFRGSRYDCMNDPTDFVFARDRLLPFVAEKMNCSVNDLFERYPYIVSFCKSQDDFLMWRLYNADVALVFDENKFPKEWGNGGHTADSTIYYRDVEYAKDDIYELRKLAEEMNESGMYRVNEGTAIDIEYYINVIPFIKNEAYRCENEFRLVCFDDQSSKAKFVPTSDDKCEFISFEKSMNIGVIDVKDGDLRLYKNFEIPKEAFKGILVHVFDDKKFQSIKRHLEAILNDRNYLNYDINKTQSYPVK